MDTQTGCVKWFNSKAGYGFISTDNAESCGDIFVHHSAINVCQSQYKYLVQGEYVSFTQAAVENNTHKFQASNVCGVNGGKLMCETRNEMRSARDEHHASAPAPSLRQSSAPAPSLRQSSAPMYSRKETSRPPQLGKTDQAEWMIVPRRSHQGQQRQQSQQSQVQQPRQRQPTVELSSN